MKFRPFNEINTICSRTIALDLGRIVVHCLFVRVHTTRLRLNQLPVACEVSQVFGKAWRTDSIEEIWNWISAEVTNTAIRKEHSQMPQRFDMNVPDLELLPPISYGKEANNLIISPFYGNSNSSHNLVECRLGIWKVTSFKHRHHNITNRICWISKNEVSLLFVLAAALLLNGNNILQIIPGVLEPSSEGLIPLK